MMMLLHRIECHNSHSVETQLVTLPPSDRKLSIPQEMKAFHDSHRSLYIHQWLALRGELL